ncbi:MAG: metalloregulator ArsR/SmtB family transcription factor [Planctomycetota bacterium]|nr:metalloregulator ArsR/SmtB family transcription factor [Planctomycetota bacterium]
MSKSKTTITCPHDSESAITLDSCCTEALENHLPSDFFKALGDPNRIALVARLAVCGRPAKVSEIACCLPIDMSVVSRHLRQLKDAGILECEKQGKEVLYSVQYQSITKMLRGLADAIDECCPEQRRCVGTKKK